MANPRTAAFAEDPQAPSRSAADEIDVKAAFTNFPKLIGINSSLSNYILMNPFAAMGPIRDLWLNWKMLKLPWRKTFLIGQDLQGNTFWEFKDKLNTNRLRRIVRSRHPAHFADVKISPQWHQWLRQTRYDPPSMQEQHADLGRQAQLKYLAQQADERWASKPSFLDKPRGQPKPATLPKDPGGYAVQTEPDEKEGVRSAVDTPPVEPEPPKSAKRADLRKQAGSGGPSERWQPESWTPGSAKER